MKYLHLPLILLVLYITNLNTAYSQANEDCLACHEDQTMTKIRNGKTISLYVNQAIHSKSAHKKINCVACHADLKNIEFPHNENLKKVNCDKCHADVAKSVNTDIHHSLGIVNKNKLPTCKICHGTHGIELTSNIKNKSQQICGKCHADNKLLSTYHTLGDAVQKCTNCHIKKPYKLELSKSIHSKLSCSNCHNYVVNNLKDHRLKNNNLIKADCYLCHADIAKEHRESIHGISLAAGMNEAAQCWSCHGSHSINKISSEASTVSSTKLITTCGKCHDDPSFTEKHASTIKQPSKMYALSVHGKLVASGRKDAPTCATCHGIHDIKNRIQTGSKISAIGLPNTCKNCHKEITEEYEQSIHWIAVKKGVRNAPTCNDCHSEHGIHALNTSEKRSEMIKLQETTCLKCHQDLLLSKRYNIASENANKYQDSYHGLAIMRGDKNAAMCIDCHGVHKILPKYHEESTIHSNNIAATCKKCHANSTQVFANSYSHITDNKTFAGYIENLVKTIYFWLIIGVVAFMLLHNLIIFIHDMRVKYTQEQNNIRISRFTKNELIQHVILFVSFTILAVTGFQLKYPLSWWSEGLTYLGLDEMTRRIVHRSSAVIMIALSLYHLIYLLFTSRGRTVLVALLPRFSDITQAFDNILYYLHIKKKHPEFDYYDYAEKIEYWALIWGTIIMGFTGLVLWFPTLVGDWAPTWFIKVNEIIHFYEAILATLAIVIWHWFFVILRSNDFPISYTCIDGKMEIKHYKKEHSLRYKKIILECIEIKNGKRNPNKISNFTKQFISAIEKKGLSIDDFIQAELDNDKNIHEYIQANS